MKQPESKGSSPADSDTGEKEIIEKILKKKRDQPIYVRLQKRIRELIWSLFTTTDTLEDKTILDAPKYFSDPTIAFIG
jgi:hypothetical protein